MAVDRDLVIENITNCVGLIKIDLKNLINEIEKMPTIYNTVPNKKSEWIKHHKSNMYFCANCKGLSHHRYKYCPDCGSQMWG